MPVKPRLLRFAVMVFAATVLASVTITTAAHGQAPTIGAVSPQAVKPGGAVDVTIRGGNLAGVTQLWTSFPAEAVLAPDVANNGQDNAQVVYRVTLPADAPVGVHGIRVATPRGLSPLRLIVLDDLPSVPQQANNTVPSAAQSLTLPTAVDGTVGNLSRNYYKFQAEAGQRVAIEAVARRMGSALDPMIRLLDAAGRELAYSDDEPGLSGDARLCHSFEAAGEYVVEVRDIRYQGGGNHYYRLRIGDFPCVSVPYPLGAKRGGEATVAFAGPDVTDVPPVKVAVPADPQLEWLTVGAKREGGQSSGFVTLSVGDNDEFLETEPNNDAANSNRVTLGVNLNGRFEQPGDVDRFVFAATKGQQFTFTAVTRQQGSPADLYLQLLKPDGGKVAESDDAGTSDSLINYTFPEDGDYTLVVEDLHRRGGSEFAYRVEVTPSQTGFSLDATADHLNIPVGGTASITVNSVRQGYNGAITLAAVDLPAGVVSTRAVIGPGQNTAVLTLQGTAEVPAGSIVPVKIVGSAKIGDKDFQATSTITGALTAANNAIPYPPQVLSKSLAVAAAPASPFKLRWEPAEIVFGKDLNTKAKVIVERQAETDEAIALTLIPDKIGLPGGVTAALKPIAKGTNEIEIVFAGNNQAPLGDFSAVLVGTHKKGNVTVTQPTPGISLKLQGPFTLKADAGEAKLAKGGNLMLKVAVERNPALSAPVVLAFENLPKGVTAAAATIPADKNEIEVVLTAAQDAAVGAVTNIAIKGEATVGNVKHAGASPAVSLTVE